MSVPFDTSNREMGFSRWLLLLFIIFPIILELLAAPTCLAQKACTPAAEFCWTCSNTGSYTNGSMYQQNLNSLLSSFSSNTTQNQADSGFYSSSLGEDSERVNAIALCRGDLGLNACLSCVNNSTDILLQNCLYQKEAILWASRCMVRYSDNLIFGIEKDDPSMYVPSLNNVSNAQEFELVLNPFFETLSDKAASGDSVKKFAAGHAIVPGSEKIYALVQCTPDIAKQNCSNCLKMAISDIPGNIGGKQGGRILKPSCSLRYEVGLFYESTADSLINVSAPVTPASPTTPVTPVTPASPTTPVTPASPTTPVTPVTPASPTTPVTPASPTTPVTPVTPAPLPSKQGKKNNTKKTVTNMIIIIVVVIAFVTMLLGGKCIFLRVKQPSLKLKDDVSENFSFVDSLQYDFENIRSATDDFSDANKLGQGGFGAVYKGRLLNGQYIAVKRLSKNSGQGDREFKKEVMLLAQLQHRNLVRLLGFCLKGEERLLIYEYIPNTSLNHFIFDPINHKHLNWETRYKIIRGIARGILYLHEDSRLRIIHHDIKASNILLGKDMNPKIADFGMARLILMDQTQGDTNTIVGTYGYMAPEYAIHGHFSVKSDVFSFGVLVLEIISGKKISIFRNGENEENLLSYAWRNCMDDTIPNIIDPTLTTGSRNEMIRCIYIGLLCVQENVNDRPTMASVVSMLNSHSFTLPVPSRPAYYLHYNSESDISRSDKSKSFVYVSRNEVSNITEPYPR